MRLVEAGSNAKYAQGHLLFLREDTLMAQPFDVTRLELRGDAVALAEQVGFVLAGGIHNGFSGSFTVSETGSLVYWSGAAGRQLVWRDRSGKTLGTLGAPDATLAAPRLSADGRVAVFRAVQGNQDIWVLDGARATRITSAPGLDRSPVWSPDGGRVAFDSAPEGGKRNLYVKPPTGAGTEQLLLESAQGKVVTDWSQDGRHGLVQGWPIPALSKLRFAGGGVGHLGVADGWRPDATRVSADEVR
jgi:dipeptidyl aminopeptidase/acylaminoacyl peptidase